MKRLQLPSDAWRKSSYSADSSNCVEVGRNTRQLIVVRDSKMTLSDVLHVEFNDWQHFTEGLKDLG
ncbi:MAG TPA: DUF397 domain-containing protein [Trebonia sp.]|nr:DUF397 domain-containing protein [Trebonia sp.]